MPQRTNDFQRLILLIEASLAPAGATVTESAMVVDPGNGKETEVDVLIEFTLGARPWRIAVECRDHGRPAGIGWIRELIGKYQRLNMNRVVAVSKSGFSRPAVVRANDAGIDICTLDEALETDWESSFSRLTTIHDMTRRIEKKQVQIFFVDTAIRPSLPTYDLSETSIYLPDGTYAGSPLQIIDVVILSDDIERHIPFGILHEDSIPVRINCERGESVRDINGNCHKLDFIGVDIGIQDVTQQTSLVQSRYGENVRVASAVMGAAGIPFALTLVQEQGQGTQIRVSPLPHR